MASTLCELPDELTICIIEQIGSDLETLQNLILCSHRFQALTEPFLYSSLLIRETVESVRLHQALSARPRRSNSVQTIDARLAWRSGAGYDNDHSSLAKVLRQTVHLRELTIESPYCNNGRWRLVRATTLWRPLMQALMEPLVQATGLRGHPPMTLPVENFRPLQELTSLTLHLNGEGREFWTVQGLYAAIFAHPSLQNLHISSANLLRDTTGLISNGLKTPLRRLTLDECNITVAGLHGILSLPKGLKYLYIGENNYSPEEEDNPPGQAYNRLFDVDPVAFLQALGLQRHTLETLVYSPKVSDIPVFDRPRPVLATGLREFHVLHEVETTARRTFIRELFSSDMTSPPNITQLSIRNVDYRDFFDSKSEQSTDAGGVIPVFFQNAVSAMPKLKQLRLICPRPTFMDDLKISVTAAGDFMKERDVTLQILQRPTWIGSSCVRPILYGEELKPDDLVYANDGTGFIHGDLPERAPLDWEYHDPDWADVDGSEDESEDEWEGDGTIESASEEAEDSE